jgi:hypothetical protein
VLSVISSLNTSLREQYYRRFHISSIRPLSIERMRWRGSRWHQVDDSPGTHFDFIAYRASHDMGNSEDYRNSMGCEHSFLRTSTVMPMYQMNSEQKTIARWSRLVGSLMILSLLASGCRGAGEEFAAELRRSRLRRSARAERRRTLMQRPRGQCAV